MKPKESLIIIFAVFMSLFLVAGCASNTVQDTGVSNEIYDLKDVDAVPVAREPRATPVYPSGLRDKNITGEAILAFVVNAKGNVEQVRVIRASHEQFGQAAKAAVEQWKYKPARKDGRPVNCRMQLPMAFDIRL